MRYPVVDGQGNFGSVDGDPPAAMRYTEVRMARLAHEFLQDIDKETVNFQPNYDNSLLEPMVLPARVPSLLLNGSSGIAVGMATNIPPHNLRELCTGIQKLLEQPDLTVRELMRYIPAPDFPTAALSTAMKAFAKLMKPVEASSRCAPAREVEETSGRRQRLIVTELPYQVNKARLLEKIAILSRKSGSVASRTFAMSPTETACGVLELKVGEIPKVVENQLYKYTQLEMTFGVIMLAVVNNKPQVLNLREILLNFLEFRRTIIVRRTQFELQQAEKRAPHSGGPEEGAGSSG